MSDDKTSFTQSQQKTSEPLDMFEDTDNLESLGNESFQESVNVSTVPSESILESNPPKEEFVTSSNNSLSGVQKLLVVLLALFLVGMIGFGLFWYYNKILTSRIAEIKTLENKIIPVKTPSVVNPQEIPVIPTKPPVVEVEQPAPIQPIKTEPTPAVIDVSLLDTDKDGLTDKEETQYGTDSRRADTDSDGLYDKEEIFKYKTDPLDSDTDGDSYSDGSEVLNGYNPKGSGKIEFVIPQKAEENN